MSQLRGDFYNICSALLPSPKRLPSARLLEAGFVQAGIYWGRSPSRLNRAACPEGPLARRDATRKNELLHNQ